MLKPLLWASLLALAAPVASAQDSSTPSALAGTWQGTLSMDAAAFRIGLVVTATDVGHDAYLVIIDQDGTEVPVAAVALTGDTLHLDIPAIGGGYDGTLGPDGRTIAGALMLEAPVPLTFARVDALDPPATFEDAEEADVRAVVDLYFRAFSDADWDAFRSVFSAPLILWSVGGTPEVLETADENVVRMRDVRESLPPDYAATRVARVVITPLSATQALADVHWRRDRQDGSLLGEGAEILTLVRTPDGWKIAGYMGRALSQFGKAF